MSIYLKRDGTAHAFLPELDQFVEIKGEEMAVDYGFVVTLYKGDGIPPEAIAEERFTGMPSEAQIKWCMYRHRADSARVTKEYTLTL